MFQTACEFLREIDSSGSKTLFSHIHPSRIGRIVMDFNNDSFGSSWTLENHIGNLGDRLTSSKTEYQQTNAMGNNKNKLEVGNRFKNSWSCDWALYDKGGSALT